MYVPLYILTMPTILSVIVVETYNNFHLLNLLMKREVNLKKNLGFEVIKLDPPPLGD